MMKSRQNYTIQFLICQKDQKYELTKFKNIIKLYSNSRYQLDLIINQLISQFKKYKQVNYKTIKIKKTQLSSQTYKPFQTFLTSSITFNRMNKQNNPNLSNAQQNRDIKNTKVSFKQFQQHYHDHLSTQKEKKRQQVQSLKKITQITKSNAQNKNPDTKSRIKNSHQSFSRQNSKAQIKKGLSTQINSINPSNTTSCFASPKASSQMFIKSINLASNQSNNRSAFRFSQNNGINLKIDVQQQQKQKQPLKNKNYDKININLRGNNNIETRKVSNNTKNSINSISKNKHVNNQTSFSKLQTDYDNQTQFSSYPSSKMLLNQKNIKQSSFSTLLQQIHNVNRNIQYLNQNIRNQQINKFQLQKNELKKTQNCKAKNTILKQMILYLKTHSKINPCRNFNEINQLHQNLISLLQNYSNDIQSIYLYNSQNIQNQLLQNNQNTQNKNNQRQKNKNLQIKIQEDQIKSFDLHNQFKKEETRKKTIKLSRSRRTHEQTIPSDSIIHPFQASQFSLLNTSKLTEISRPSSHNKSNFRLSNQIENIINSKLLNTSIMEQQNRKDKNIQNRRESGSYLVKNPSKSQLPKPNKTLCDPKKKSVTKTISLLGNNNKINNYQESQIIQNYNKMLIKESSRMRVDDEENDSQQNFSKQIKLAQLSHLDKGKNKNNIKNEFLQEFQHQQSIARSFQPNQSIYELQYLENYGNNINKINHQQQKQTKYMFMQNKNNHHSSEFNKINYPETIKNKFYSNHLFQ